MQNLKDSQAKINIAEKIAQFLFSIRIILIIGISVIFISILAFFIYNEYYRNVTEESTIIVEEIENDYQEWKNVTDTTIKLELENSILESIGALLTDYSGLYAAQRALFIRGNLYLIKSEWDSAYNDFWDLSQSFPNSYLAEQALFLCGVCQENLSDLDKAIEIYQKIEEDYKTSVLIPGVLFSLGRIYEFKEDYINAYSYYKKLDENHSKSGWTKFAINRIIYLRVEGKI